MIAFFSSLFQAEKAIKQYRREEQWRQVRTVTIFTIAYSMEFRRSCFNLEDMTNCADNKMLGAKAGHCKQFDRRRH